VCVAAAAAGVVPSAGAVLRRHCLWWLHDELGVRRFCCCHCVVVIVMLGDSVGADSASISSWACSLKSVSSLP
jgi:hypothetical protein